MDPLAFKICPRPLWGEAERAGIFAGAPVDEASGFIHLSFAHQLAETAARHFKDQDDLVLVAVWTRRLGDKLVLEPSRGGALFPHLYGALPLDAVAFVKPLSRINGRHVFPELTP